MSKWIWMSAALSAMAMVSSQAMAVTGGGAMVPAKLYKGSADSLMPANFIYTAPGSGDGKIAFLTNDASKLGMTGPVHFAASESVLTREEISTYNANLSRLYGPLIQLPSLHTPVAIAYKKSGISNLNLTSVQLCEAFSGTKTTWGNLLGTSDDTPIRIVYSKLSSGATEILTRHLASVCPIQFAMNPVFTKARLNYAQVPSNWVSVSYDDNVASVINAVDGSIGYAGPDDVDAKNNAVVARINGIQPTPVNVVLALSGVSPPYGQSVFDPQRWAPVVGKPPLGYAISGFSNLIIGQCYKDEAVANDLRNFLAAHYSFPGNITSPVAHGFIRMLDSWKTAITNNFLTNKLGNNLDINNPSICNGIGRP
jgi:ABC-type phosphate transport system substrate-binding protein